jgi:hypothetical protein
MAHFAKLDGNNIVQEVLVVNNDVITVDGNESEQAGINFLSELTGHQNWKQTSYSGSFRKRFAAEGMVYDPTVNAFYDIKSFPSWVWDETELKYTPPVPHPQDGFVYDWVEALTQWVKVNQ